MKLPLTDHNASDHPAYDDAVRQAAHRAFEYNHCWSVWYDGERVYVRDSKDVPPEHAKLICIAQRWNDKTVQVRFDGARSEWINV